MELSYFCATSLAVTLRFVVPSCARSVFFSPLWWFISPEQESHIHCEYLILPCLPLILLMLTHAVYYSIENLQQYGQEREEQHNVCLWNRMIKGFSITCHAIQQSVCWDGKHQLQGKRLHSERHIKWVISSSESSSNAFMLDEWWENNREALECLRRFFPLNEKQVTITQRVRGHILTLHASERKRERKSSDVKVVLKPSYGGLWRNYSLFAHQGCIHLTFPFISNIF